MSINRVVLVGRLTFDPELRTTTSGKPVATLKIAVTKRFKREGEPDADFFTVTAWGASAEFCNNYLSKGRLIAVDGRLQSRKYTTQDGSQREVIEVVADNVQSLDRPKDEGGQSAQQQEGGEDEYDPFADE